MRVNTPKINGFVGNSVDFEGEKSSEIGAIKNPVGVGETRPVKNGGENGGRTQYISCSTIRGGGQSLIC